MPFQPAEMAIPEELRTADLWLRPLRETDVERDYEAVMDSGTELRLRTGGRWPRVDFTLEENAADLRGHEEDWGAHEGFTYTIHSPDGSRCAGCIYIYPLRGVLERVGADAETIAATAEDAAQVWFWLRPAELAAGLDRELLEAFVPWVRREFAFSRLVFSTESVATHQTTLFEELGWERIGTYERKTTDLLLFEPA